MLQAANTDLFNPLAPKAHNSECRNLPSPLQIRPVKVTLMVNLLADFAPSALTG